MHGDHAGRFWQNVDKQGCLVVACPDTRRKNHRTLRKGDSNCYAKPEHVKLHMQANKKAECLPNHVISNLSCHQQVLQKCLGVTRLPGKCYTCDHEVKTRYHILHKVKQIIHP